PLAGAPGPRRARPERRTGCAVPGGETSQRYAQTPSLRWALRVLSWVAALEVAPALPAPPTPLEEVVGHFRRYLLNERGLATPDRAWLLGHGQDVLVPLGGTWRRPGPVAGDRRGRDHLC